MPRTQHRRSISIRPESYDMLAELSLRTDRSMASIMEELIARALEEDQMRVLVRGASNSWEAP